jgi:TRAP-type C4-dicarboxylate transport system substrate-binding protein
MTRLFITLFSFLFALYAQPGHAVTTLKVGSLAPTGTTWDKGLRAIAADWEKITNGEVKLKIYAGGVLGNETVMLRKIRIGQLHGAAITNMGLVEIEPSAQVTSTPMLIHTHDEYDYVMARMIPVFEKRIEAAGFVPVAWTDAGWVRLFTKVPMTDPADLAKHKFFAFEGDPVAINMYKTAGFKPVVVASTDVMPSLQSGLINAFPSAPLGALAFQWFGLAKHMLDMPWAPLTAVTVFSAEAWAAIPSQYHAELRASAQRHANALNKEIRRQDAKAVEVMKKYGLTVHTPSATERAAWENTAKKTWGPAREAWVPPEVFDQVEALLNTHRASAP